MKFNIEQLDKLADLSMGLSKGLFLSSFALPAFSQTSTVQTAITILAALFFMWSSLKIIEMKEVLK